MICNCGAASSTTTPHHSLQAGGKPNQRKMVRRTVYVAFRASKDARRELGGGGAVREASREYFSIVSTYVAPTFMVWFRRTTTNDRTRGRAPDIHVHWLTNDAITQKLGLTFDGLSAATLSGHPRYVFINTRNWMQPPSHWRNVSDYRRYVAVHEMTHAGGVGHVTRSSPCTTDTLDVMEPQTKPVCGRLSSKYTLKSLALISRQKKLGGFLRDLPSKKMPNTQMHY